MYSMSSRRGSSSLSAFFSEGIYTIGLTGGIGAGKSYVARMLQERHIPVYATDQRAKALYDEDEELRESMIRLCGKEIYTTEGHLDRAYLASLIFADRALLEEVNKLVHPAVRRDFCRWRSELVESGLRLCALESALLLGAGLDEYVDLVVAVVAEESVRLTRAMLRDGASEESVRARIQHQMAEEELIDRADYVLYNDDAHPLAPQIDRLLAALPL